jgi:integrase
MPQFEDRLRAANKKLSDRRIGISIEQKGKRLYLRGTFPPKPDSKKDRSHQQYLSLGVYANPDGLRFAEKEAIRVGALIAVGQFAWAGFLRQQPKPSAMDLASAIARFEKHYFSTRQETKTTRQTFKHEYLSVFEKLQKIDIDEMKKIIFSTEPDTRDRRRAALACACLADFLELKHDLRALVGRYGVRRLIAKDIPTDSAIALAYDRIDSAAWRWAFGLQACYGLRNHEIFYADVSRFPLVQVMDGKTGSRLVFPFFLEWAEQWELFRPMIPDCTGGTNSDLGNRLTHAYKRFSVGFNPYALRHAWAVRSIRFGLHPTLAAQQMGHSPDIHYRHYQNWIDADVHAAEFARVMARGDRPMPPPG